MISRVFDFYLRRVRVRVYGRESSVVYGVRRTRRSRTYCGYRTIGRLEPLIIPVWSEYRNECTRPYDSRTSSTSGELLRPVGGFIKYAASGRRGEEARASTRYRCNVFICCGVYCVRTESAGNVDGGGRGGRLEARFTGGLVARRS